MSQRALWLPVGWVRASKYATTFRSLTIALDNPGSCTAAFAYHTAAENAGATNLACPAPAGPVGITGRFRR